MSDAPDMTSAPYPADFAVPPGMPVPTAEDVASASKPHGGGVAQVNPPTPWWEYALAIGGAVIVGAVAVSVYKSKKVPLTLPPFDNNAFAGTSVPVT